VAGIRITLFGRVRVWRDEVELPSGPAQQRAVLTLLALAGGQPVGRDRLIAALWPDKPPPSAWNIVQTHVKRLRAALEPGRPAHRPSSLLPSAGDGYALRVGPDQVDALRFRALVERAAEPYRRGDHAAAWPLLGEALALWTAAPVADVPLLADHPAVAALGGLRQAALGRYVDGALALGRGAEVVEAAQRAAADRPLDELAQARLIQVYQAAGRRADAFDVYHDTRSRLADRLGVDPGPDLAAAHLALLHQDQGQDQDADHETAGPAADLQPATARLQPTLDQNQPASRVPPAARRPQRAPARLPLRLPAPAQLPADVADFVGRCAHLTALDDLLTNGGPAPTAAAATVAAIGGAAGVGKTALLLRWSHRVADRFPDGCLYVDLRGYGPQPPLPPEAALAGFLAALGITRAEPPGDLAELAARYRTALAGRRVLVLLDNARSPDQVRPLLPGGPGCRTVVTSRNDLAGLVARDGARRIVLEPMPTPEAATLLHALLGARADDEPGPALALAEACDRLPLALRIAAELALSRPGATLGELLAELTGHQHRLDLLNAGGDEATGIRAVFSWSYSALPAAAARAFRLLGLHPGREFDAAGVAALTGLPAREAALSMDSLIRLYLVAQAGSGWYTMHDLLREYARELAEQHEPEAEQRAAITRLLDELTSTAAAAMDAIYPFERNRRPKIATRDAPLRTFAGPEPAQAWLEAQTATLLAAAVLAADHGLSQHVAMFSSTLHRHLHTTCRYNDMLELHGCAAQVMHDYGDIRDEGAALRDLGLAYHRLARYPEALSNLSWALEIAEDVNDLTGQSGALHGLGMVHFRLGDLPQALSHFDQALAVNRTIGDRAAEGAVLGNIGLVHEWQGDRAGALDLYRRALAIHREIGFRAGEGDALNNIAIVHRQEGNYPEAISHLEQALEVYRSINDPGGQGAALNNLGLAHISTCRWSESREYLLQALDTHRAIGSLGAEAETLNILGLLDCTMGRHEDAVRCFDQALALAELTADLGSQTNSHHGLGQARLGLGDPAEALGHHEQALALARRTGSPGDEARAAEAITRCTS
jgi:tetratricopeptide (TPR) repeat protein